MKTEDDIMYTRTKLEEIFFMVSSCCDKELARELAPMILEYRLQKEIEVHQDNINRINEIIKEKLSLRLSNFYEGAHLAYKGRIVHHTECIDIIKNQLMLIPLLSNTSSY